MLDKALRGGGVVTVTAGSGLGAEIPPHREWPHCCFLTAPSCLCSCSLPGLDGCLNLLFETQGRGHRQVSVLRSPMGSCLVSFSLSWLPLRREELPLFSRICSIFPFIFQWVWLP